ncbi:hypothetical protein [Mariprofundus sp. KV]|uniref:hypothetical protein n=1 Tax=Mariprofundus sp. KV TaxID=2608715 RepID=UPI0015A29574|nr:hypothetical protein [Mariprofundus sp. KV]NWF35393.1 hypothetical protein [Mariprofundus sp. KV]
MAIEEHNRPEGEGAHAKQTDDKQAENHPLLHGHHYDIHSNEESEAVHRLRARHQQLKHGHESHDERAAESRLDNKQRQIKPRPHKKGKRRAIFWGQIAIALFIFITAGLTIRAIEMATIKSGSPTWIDELKQGNINLATEKFSITASAAVAQVFSSDLSIETLMKDFNDALPHLKKAGYILIEMEVELGIPPKLIPHFYHDGDIKLDMEKTLQALGDNSIGKALIIALSQAGELQKQIEVADMKFDYIEVELGPIPGLKLQYKNYYAVKKKIFR